MTSSENERIAVLETEMATLQRDMADLRSDVRIIRDTLLQARGGWKTLMLVAGLASTLGALLTKFIPFLMMKP
jgi:chromosome condensin MukBEF ATPase and DNA-binding subunit MukB